MGGSFHSYVELPEGQRVTQVRHTMEHNGDEGDVWGWYWYVFCQELPIKHGELDNGWSEDVCYLEL